MLKAVEHISETKKRLKIEVLPDIIDKEVNTALEKLRQRVKLPGFRQGKAPLSLIEKRFGKEAEADAFERLISDSYRNALKEANIIPVSQPVFEESIDFKRNNPLSMTLTVEVRPTLNSLKYEGIKVKDIPVNVEEADIEGTLKRLQEEKTVYEPSEEEIKVGDIVVIDLKEVGGGTATLNDQMIRVGDEFFPHEISNSLIGKKKVDEISLTAKFPEVFPIRELAGKNSELMVMIKEVKKAHPPSLDEEFAKDVGFDSLSALRSHIEDEILKAKKDTKEKILKAEIMKRIIEENEFPAPESLVEKEFEDLMANAQLKGQLPNLQDRQEEQALKEKLREDAIRNIKAELLINIIGEKEGIQVEDEEVKREISSLAERLRLSPENVVKYFVSRDGSMEGLRHSIFEEKVLDLLLKKAIIEKGD